MDRSLIHLEIEQSAKPLEPGSLLRGCWQIQIENAPDLMAIELSVLWITSGKGDQDLQVHYFERRESDDPESRLTERQQFETQLPLAPLSYDGLLMQLRWCVRLRVFPARGREIVIDRPFVLGHVPAAQVLS